MPLAPIPPWLNINPSQFVDAAKAGTQLGVEMARSLNQSDQAGAEVAARNAALAAREQEAAMERAFKEWELEQTLRQKARETQANHELAAAQLAETMRYHTGSLSAENVRNLASLARTKALSAPRPMNIGGVGYVYNPVTGDFTAKTPGQPEGEVTAAKLSEVLSNPLTQSGFIPAFGPEAYSNAVARVQASIKGVTPLAKQKLRTEAYQALAEKKDPAAVRKRYRDLTGEELPAPPTASAPVGGGIPMNPLVGVGQGPGWSDYNDDE